jgi:hypothetical protein
MKKVTLAALAVTVVAALLVIGLAAMGASIDLLLGRYPGSTPVRSIDVELDYLRRGWLNRQSIYQTPADLETVRRWYVKRYRPISSAHANAGEPCMRFRSSRLQVRIVHAVTVSLCRVPAGTRIVVIESAFFSPPPNR